MIKQTATRAINVSLPAMADSLDHLPPVAHQRVQLMKDAAAGEPVARLAKIIRRSVVAILPDAPLIEYLDCLWLDDEFEGKIRTQERLRKAVHDCSPIT